MDALFYITGKCGKLIPDNRYDLETYLLENEGEELLMSIKPVAKTSEKMRMYAYLFGIVMEAAVRGFTYQGWQGMDKVKARYRLQAEFCKAEMYNEKTDTVEIFLEELSGMSKKRLYKFLMDCIWYVEENLQQKVPDSSRYKNMKKDEIDLKFNR